MRVARIGELGRPGAHNEVRVAVVKAAGGLGVADPSPFSGWYSHWSWSVVAPDVRAVIVEPAEPIARTRDLEATGPNGPIPLRVYQPLEIQAPGTVVFYHGGGWVLSTIP